MALSKIQAESVNLADTFAFTGTVNTISTVVPAEGGSATTNLVQGLAKAWVNLNVETFGARDSFNVASTLDNGSGDSTMTFLSVMSNDDYACSGLAAYPGSRGYIHGSSSAISTPFATTAYRMVTSYISATDGSTTADNPQHDHRVIHGDLA
jgi:hypothetical protein